MWTAFPPSDYYADSATPRAHRPASGLAGPPPAARRARGASHVHHDPFDRVGSWLYPYSASGGHSQHPVGHHARVKEPGAERAAVKQGGVVAVDDPDPPGFGSLQDSRGFYHHFAFALPFGLASTHAGVWQYRPAVALSGRLTSDARSRALAVPSFSEPLHQPGTGIPAGTDEMLMSVISFRMAPRGAGSTFLGFTHICANDRHGRFKLKRVTSKKKMRAKLKSVKTEMRRRMHHPIPEQGRWLASVLQGHYNYYAVPDNSEALHALPTTGHPALAPGASASQPERPAHLEAHASTSLTDGYPSRGSCIPGPTRRFDARTQGRSPVR